MNRIAVIGSVNTDMVIRSSQIPIPGQTLIGHSFMTTGGGKGANQAVAAARLGGEVSLIAKIGADAFGEMSIQSFKEEKINTQYIFTDKETPSGVAIITVDDAGENIIVVAPGANATLNERDLADAVSVIREADIVLFQLEIPLETVKEGIRLAKQYGRRVILNPAPAAIIPDDVFQLVDIIIPNQTEAGLLTGIVVNNEDRAQKASNVLHVKGVPIVIITLGEKGAFLSSENFKGMIAGFNAGLAIDTVAAGDTFCGALAIALAEENNIQNAVRFANAAAALSVTRRGAQSSVPNRSEVDRMLENIVH